MGLKRDNRARQRLGILLNLSSKEQEQRNEWQREQGYKWSEIMPIASPKAGDKGMAKMSWSFAGVLDLETMSYVRFEKAGSKTIAPKAPKWYAHVKTEKTDAISRRGIQAKKNERY